MRGWLKAHFQQKYYPAVSILEDTPEDREVAQQWSTWMREQWGNRNLSTLSQQRNLMTEVRSALKERLGEEHWILEVMNFTTDEWTQINEEANKVVSDRNEQQSLIDEPQAIVDRAEKLLHNREWSDIVAGLAVVTGRRCAELLKTAKFEKASAYSVWFTGALKRRSEKDLKFEIPTLIPAKQVIEALAKVRAWVDTEGMDNRKINNRYSAAVSRVCDVTFADLVPLRAGRDSLYTHLFRTIYARIATHWYAPPEVADLEYMAAIQGHFLIQNKENPEQRRSLASTRHYNDYKIGNGKGNIDGRQGIKLEEPGVTILQAFRSKEAESLIEVEVMEEAQKRQRSSLHIFKDEKDRWQTLFESVAGDNQQQKMSALLPILEAQLLEGAMTQIDLPKLETLAEQFVESLKPLKGAALIRCICQREVLLLEIFYAQDYLKVYQDAIATAIRAGELPLIDGITAHRESFLKEGVQYETRTHYAFKFLEDQEFDAGEAVEPKVTTTRPSATTPEAKASTTSKAAPIKEEIRKQGRPKSAEAEARVQAAIDAIMAYNDAPGRTHEEKWAINGFSVKQLRSTHQSLIKRVIEANKDVLDKHHQKHGLGKRHNRIHSQAGVEISDVIQI